MKKAPAAPPRDFAKLSGLRVLIVDDHATIRRMLQTVFEKWRMNAIAVEMEGAAVAQVCARFGVPVIVIRSITDHADGGAAGSYRQFVDMASRNAADLALATIREMLK